MTPRVGWVALALGFAGLLPQVAAAGLVVTGLDAPLGQGIALLYGGLILSFLGGIWWGFAMRRDAGQASLAAVAVLPSLAALAIGLGQLFVLPRGAALVALGAAIFATLLVDRHLVATGEAPDNWMALRVPLSLGLGGLTILAGLL